MRKYEPEDVIEIIKSGKSPADSKAWMDMIKVLRSMPVYMEVKEREKAAVTDQDGLRIYRLYLKKPDTNAQACEFIRLTEEARELEISLLISISKEEPESLLLEEPSEFLYFVNAEESETGKIILI